MLTPNADEYVACSSISARTLGSCRVLRDSLSQHSVPAAVTTTESMIARDPFARFEDTCLSHPPNSTVLKCMLQLQVMASLRECLAETHLLAKTVMFHDDGATYMCATSACSTTRSKCNCVCGTQPGNVTLWTRDGSQLARVGRLCLSPPSICSFLRHAPLYAHVRELALLPHNLFGGQRESALNDRDLGVLLSDLPSLVCLALATTHDVSDVVCSCPRLRSVFVLHTDTLQRSMPHLTRFSCARMFPQSDSDGAVIGEALAGCTSLTALRLRENPHNVRVNTVLENTVTTLQRLRFLAIEVPCAAMLDEAKEVEDCLPRTLRMSVFSNAWGSIRTCDDGIKWVENRGSRWLHLRALLQCARAVHRPTASGVGAAHLTLTAPNWLFQRVTAYLLSPLLRDFQKRRFDVASLHAESV